MLRHSQLHGFNVGGAPSVATLSFISSATSVDNTNVTAPAGILAGDLLIYLDFALAAGAFVTPTGFTNIAQTQNGGGTVRLATSYKIAVGTESSTAIAGNTSGTRRKVLAVFRGNVPITGVVVSTPNAQATTGNPTAQNAAASGGIAPLVVIGAYGSGDSPP